MQENYVDRILKAKVYDVAVETPLDAAPRLSRRLDNRILFKREDLQPVFSFKIRGAYNKIAQLSPFTAQRGVICASAGNHAQGVAWAPAPAAFPRHRHALTTPDIKVQAVADLGGEIVLHGDDYDQAYEHALELGRERALVFVHPFDDPDVIAGQGTIAMEILRQHGTAMPSMRSSFPWAAAASLRESPHTPRRCIRASRSSAWSRRTAGMYESLRAGKRITLERVGMFADGVAVRRVGEETFASPASTWTKSSW
jgi:threonine dehydratase